MSGWSLLTIGIRDYPWVASNERIEVETARVRHYIA